MAAAAAAAAAPSVLAKEIVGNLSAITKMSQAGQAIAFMDLTPDELSTVSHALKRVKRKAADIDEESPTEEPEKKTPKTKKNQAPKKPLPTVKEEVGYYFFCLDAHSLFPHSTALSWCSGA